MSDEQQPHDNDDTPGTPGTPDIPPDFSLEDQYERELDALNEIQSRVWHEIEYIKDEHLSSDTTIYMGLKMVLDEIEEQIKQYSGMEWEYLEEEDEDDEDDEDW